MPDFSFLKNLKLRENLSARSIKSSERNPDGLTLRVFRNGRVFPSKDLVAKYNLEFQPNNAGNGIDYFSSSEWSLYPATESQAILLAFTPRTINGKPTKKLDLFNYSKEVKREENTTSTSISVVSQGPRHLDLWELAIKTYGMMVPEDRLFIDLEVHIDLPINTEDSIYLLPKRISRGEKKGTLTYIRRENITLFLLLPVSTKTTEVVVEREVKENEVQQTDLISLINP